MADSNLTPEEYLKQLNEAAATHDRTGQRVPTPNPYQPQQPGMPPTGNVYSPTPPSRAQKRSAIGCLVVIVVIAVAASIAVIAVLAAVTSSSDDESSSLENATGTRADRGREAKEVFDSVTVPSSWTKEGEQDVSLDGEGDDATARIGQRFTAPRDYTPDDLRAWFAEQPFVTEHLEDARCSGRLDGSDASCDLTVYQKDSDGRIDYDLPRRALRVSFYRGSSDDEETRVSLDTDSRS